MREKHDLTIHWIGRENSRQSTVGNLQSAICNLLTVDCILYTADCFKICHLENRCETDIVFYNYCNIFLFYNLLV
ncbi:hypothetical protein KSMBR1_1586 [Candidatus Kuenenia stuttgartiensis]|uniref:Uncharacterized protein n=1 Tax=Kuenenia stuttgartiensis TaxID=174633 RepID=A0A2C9CEL3_KUEST|nr:hypothetical protein KSMBR1_1586 [Candidatus Kuenenia stuttgartiensis]